jgi:translocation protein SEC72
MEETFTLLPLTIDPSTKAISASSTDTLLSKELHALNATHRGLLSLGNPAQVPPPPLPIDPKRSAAIQKMREQGNASLSKRPNPAQPQQHIHDAIRLYTFALDMCLGRPPWEPAALVRDEAALLFSNRAQAHIALQMWPEGAADAATSVEMKAGPGQGKAWWRRGKCLVEMGRWEEAEEWVGRAQLGDGEGQELRGLAVEIAGRVRRNREALAAGKAQ